MEEWEDELQDELSEKVEEFTDKGLTIRQVLGVLETLKCELISTIIVFDPEEE